MKLKNSSFFIRNKLMLLKSTVEKSKMHFAFCGGAALLGLMIALFKNYKHVEVTNNFFIHIQIGTANPVGYSFLMLLFTTLLFATLIATSYRYIMFLLFGYGTIAIATFLLFKMAFISAAVDGFLGALFIILFVIPIFIFNLLCFSLALNKMYEFCSYSYNRKLKCSNTWQFTQVLKIIRPFLLISLAFNFLLWLVLHFIFSLIF